MDILVFNLVREGYDTLSAGDGVTALRMALEDKPDLILLDVMLPEMDGFEVLRRVREQSQVPIIMVTAREEESDKVDALELGADDYITKPFSNRELIARVKANMRRTAVSGAEPPAVIDDGRLVISPEQSAVYKNGRLLDLSVHEYGILVYLAEAQGRVVSREELLERVWEYTYIGDTMMRTVDVAIRRLREKIEDDSSNPRYIITKRGVGYYYAENG